jgi:Mn-dependent DtxR family transcriptional regulator
VANVTTVNHPIISGYLKGFITSNEISKSKAKDEHLIFEMFINDLILKTYGNDINVSYEDMETGTAFGIDGVAIFVNDKMIEGTDDVDFICQSTKKFDVQFIFTQSKVTPSFNRTEIGDFLQGVNRFFNFEHCEIKELKNSWEIAKYIYSMSNRFKKIPELSLFFVTLSPEKISIKDEKLDEHLKAEIETKIKLLKDKLMFDEDKLTISLLGIKDIMDLYNKNSSHLEIKFNMDKQLVPYPKDPTKIISSGYFGLIKLEDLLQILTEEIDGDSRLRKGIFEDNIRDYLGSNEKVEVNAGMKEVITGKSAHLFGLLNNGITIIADSVDIVSTEVTLTNYQIVNGCQTSNVIFECIDEIKAENIYIPIRLIGTKDEETKNAIIKATNSQTGLKPEQLLALTAEQKALEEYYKAKRDQNRFDLYYERRTEQYRNDEIQKTKIINIPFQIKAVSALFLNLPDEVSGQYGKVEQKTRGRLFKDTKFLNSYYVSGLVWYRVESFIRNTDEGRKYRRSRWHLIMTIRYLIDKKNICSEEINKESEQISKEIEKVMLDDTKSSTIIDEALRLIKEFLSTEGITDISDDRKLFEKKETTVDLIEFIKNK